MRAGNRQFPIWLVSLFGYWAITSYSGLKLYLQMKIDSLWTKCTWQNLILDYQLHRHILNEKSNDWLMNLDMNRQLAVNIILPIVSSPIVCIFWRILCPDYKNQARKEQAGRIDVTIGGYIRKWCSEVFWKMLIIAR